MRTVVHVVPTIPSRVAYNHRFSVIKTCLQDAIPRIRIYLCNLIFPQHLPTDLDKREIEDTRKKVYKDQDIRYGISLAETRKHYIAKARITLVEVEYCLLDKSSLSPSI